MRRTFARLLAVRWLAFAVAGILIVALGAELVTLARSDSGPEAPPATVATARRFAVAVTSFDYRHLDRDVAKVLSFGSAGFERDFRAAMGPDFTGRIVTAKSVSRGKIVAGPEVQRVKRGRVSLFVVVNQQVTSDTPDSTPRLIRVGLLVDVDERTGKVDSVRVM